MDTQPEIPDEDRWLKDWEKRTPRRCQHEYIDAYAGWCYVDKERTRMLQWMFCKKCLNRRKVYFDLSEGFNDEEDFE